MHEGDWEFAQVALDNAKTADLLQSNLLNPDAALAVFSSYNLPKVREHQRLAEELKTTLTRDQQGKQPAASP